VRVHIVQPALSRQIRALEEELGLRLFERDRRRVALTPAGAVFLEETRSLLDHVARAVDAAKRADRGELGSLRIGYVPAMVSTGLPEMVRRFRERYPGVDVQLHEMTPALQVEALLREQVDVGFVRGPVHEPALETQTVLEEPLVAALPSGHRLGRHKRLRLAMLAGEPFVLQARSSGPGSHDQILAVCRSAGFSPRIVQEGSQAEVASLVASGAGVAIVPASLRAIRRAGVLYRPLHERPMTRLDVAWRKDAASPVLRAFLAEVQQSARSVQPKAR
jgi:DNA-binding transcriptional LysR family regulator